MNSSGQIAEKKESDIPKPEISQTARDVESHTGEESLERQAKREVSKILETAESWRELHEQLCSKGYLLEKRGNGAVLRYGDKSVKLSNVSRSSSLSKMEQRLGKYQERQSDIQIAERSKIRLPARRSSWERYKVERESYLDVKTKAVKELRTRQKQEREELRRLQQTRRKKMFSESWKGRGRELNQLRSIFGSIKKTVYEIFLMPLSENVPRISEICLKSCTS